MKKIYLSLALLFISILLISNLKAQAPQSFKYQAVARDNIGNVLVNQNVNFKISIKQSSITGEIAYAEIHNTTTNNFGLVNLEVGNGTLVLGEFENINWGDDIFFIQIEMDIEGGSNYQLMGISQLLSVPYALFAKEAGNNSSLWNSNGDNIYYNNGKVGIGTDNPDMSATLEVYSTNTGFLPPRLTTEQRDGMENPAIGLMIFNLSTYCYNFYNGLEWMELCGENGQWECGDTLIDPRDGQKYNTVKIGDQCWMAKNMNIGTRIDGGSNQTNNGIIEKYCYDNDESNCNRFGGLYQWDEMMQYTTQQGTQGICPEGWHIPTDDEWKILEGTVDSQYGVGNPIWNQIGFRGFDAGKNLKSTDGWYLNGNGTDTFGFTSFPGGRRCYYSNTFYYIDSSNFFWSSSESNSGNSWRYHMKYDYDNISRHHVYKTYAFSVRCLKD